MLSFISGPSNFIKILLLSEISWIVLYNYFVEYGTSFDDATLISTSFLILGLAGLEFSIGLLMCVLLKNINKKINLESNQENKNFKKKIQEIYKHEKC
jgi:NADH:ubiquinone oxidoreductase subunit K